MSKAIDSVGDSRGTSTGALPRAVIHKKILDEAEAAPDASINAIANAVAGASVDLVERVLDEYGDPLEPGQKTDMTNQPQPKEAVSTTEGMNGQEKENQRQTGELPDLDTLTDKQSETLRAICKHPEATQAEIAEMLNVTSATICNRVNNINGFDWNRRRELVDSLFFVGDVVSNGDRASEVEKYEPPRSQGLIEMVETVRERVDALELHLEEQLSSSHPSNLNSDLAAKMIRACIHSEYISDEEELEIMKAIIVSSGPGS